MFSEILKIKPTIDQTDLNKMERNLSQRFNKVAKSFGRGISNIFKGGAIAGLATSVVNRLLNPLKETQEAIDRTLSSSDDIATNATQFNTTSGRLFKLIQLAKSTGLDQDSLFTLITKFQGAVAQNQADPTKSVSVSQFGGADTVQEFFSFIQSLQSLDRNAQVRAQTEVFGEKQILKLADFLQQDFSNLFRQIGLDKVATEKLTKDINKISGLNDLKDILASRRAVQDLPNKARLINQGTIQSIDQGERQILNRENERIANFKNIKAVAETAEKINQTLEKGIFQIGSFITTITPKINAAVEAISKISVSNVWRGINPFGKKGK